MIEKIKNSIYELDQKMVNNPSYLLLLSLFNCALLLNYNFVIWKNTISVLAIFFTIINFINPKFWWATVINFGLSFLVLVRHFPRMANHCNIEMMVQIIIFGIIFIKILLPKIKITSQLIQTIFKISIITIYFFTGFHKLNIDFFNPCVSCVNNINERLIGNFIGVEIKLTENWSYFFQICTVFIEIILPFGLLHFKTRTLAAMVLLFFHFWLSVVWYADFSAFALFLVMGAIVNFDEIAINSKLWTALKIYIFFTVFAVVANAACIANGYSLNEKHFTQGLIFNIGLFIFCLVFFQNYVSKPNNFYKKHIPVLSLIVILISFWGLKAYIGLGNSGNLTMFSNLLTEKNRSNHLIINTKNTKIFDFEEDNLLILKLSDSLVKDSLINFKIPVTEFKYLTSKWAKKYPKMQLNATFVYKSDTILIKNLKKSSFNDPKWWYRYINFRKIQVAGANKCYW